MQLSRTFLIWKQIVLFTMIGLVISAQPTPAEAHAVFIFGWEEGDHICSESFFGNKRKVKAGIVELRSSDGTLLEQGKTDEKGKWCSAGSIVADPVTLIILAGEGHKSTFILPRSEKKSIGPDPATPPLETPMNGNASKPSLPLQEAALETLVRQAVRHELAPVQESVRELRQDLLQPSLRDIVGGIGWIVGLCALVLLAVKRKK